MMVRELLIISMLLTCLHRTRSSTIPVASQEPIIAKRGCPTHCGNLSIPFPFGIGPSHCYLDRWFEIVCVDHFGHRPRAFLKHNMLEVLNISINEGTISVQNPITFTNCEGKDKTINNKPLSVSESPFIFSTTHNRFVAVSCGFLAFLSSSNTSYPFSNSSVVAGCSSTCSNSTNETMISTMLLHRGCFGTNCCQTTIPYHVSSFSITFQKLSDETDQNVCNFAFLGDQTWFMPSRIRFVDFNYLDYVPAILKWYLNYTEYEVFGTNLMINSTNYCYFVIFDNFYYEEDQKMMRCICKKGYHGNPYILDGCQDINECEQVQGDELYCSGKCVNTIGGYECQWPKTNLIIIGITGVLGGLILLIFTAWGLYKAIKKRKETKRKAKLFRRNGGLLLQQYISSGEVNVKNTRLFDLKELEKATDHFSFNRILGQGGQGTVYKGMLADGKIIAIKKSKIVDEEKVTEFVNEVVILSQINHRNVVKLLGCCLETEVPLLVYEFIPNGTLFEYIHKQNEDIFPLTLELRLQIASEIAGALSYLHSAASLPIYHRDIKSTNILLDEKYRAKIGDFGTSRSVAIDQTHLTTLVYGTFGYLDPEYFQSSQFTEKSDVYSFGVVLVELLTGQKPVSITKAREGLNLAGYFVKCMEENRLLDIIDSRIVKLNFDKEIMEVANLAKRCLNWNGKNRPTMKEVAIELEGIQKLVKI